jgi:hypothetical protein
LANSSIVIFDALAWPGLASMEDNRFNRRSVLIASHDRQQQSTRGRIERPICGFWYRNRDIASGWVGAI